MTQSLLSPSKLIRFLKDFLIHLHARAREARSDAFATSHQLRTNGSPDVPEERSSSKALPVIRDAYDGVDEGLLILRGNSRCMTSGITESDGITSMDEVDASPRPITPPPPSQFLPAYSEFADTFSTSPPASTFYASSAQLSMGQQLPFAARSSSCDARSQPVSCQRNALTWPPSDRFQGDALNGLTVTATELAASSRIGPRLRNELARPFSPAEALDSASAVQDAWLWDTLAEDFGLNDV